MSYGGLVALSIVLSLMAFAPAFYLWYLLLQKVQGTELMWFLYVIWIPFAVMATITSKLTDYVKVKLEGKK